MHTLDLDQKDQMGLEVEEGEHLREEVALNVAKRDILLVNARKQKMKETLAPQGGNSILETKAIIDKEIVTKITEGLYLILIRLKEKITREREVLQDRLSKRNIKVEDLDLGLHLLQSLLRSDAHKEDLVAVIAKRSEHLDIREAEVLK